ncbi:hypothetical protein [Maribacter arcticus]|uniref:hypothetical protein n=1 Tax=Maribacter arcticus TaxID=561365 RepID=UPI00300253B8
MTAQIREIIMINNDEYSMDNTPLESHLNKPPKRQSFNYRTTACWRGYRGSWNLDNDQLYLIHLKGNRYDIESKTIKEVYIDYLFPNQEKVFASWFTGVLTVPDGKILTNWNIDNFSNYEHILQLKFDKGILIDFKSVDAIQKMVNDIQIKPSYGNSGFWKRTQNWFSEFRIIRF